MVVVKLSSELMQVSFALTLLMLHSPIQALRLAQGTTLRSDMHTHAETYCARTTATQIQIATALPEDSDTTPVLGKLISRSIRAGGHQVPSKVVPQV